MKFCVRYKDCCVGCSMDFYALRLMGLRGQEATRRQIEDCRSELDQLDKKRDVIIDIYAANEIEKEIYLQRMDGFKKERNRLLSKLEQFQNVINGAHQETARTIIELAMTAKSLWNQRSPVERRQLLDLLLSNRSLNGASIEYDLKKPFKILSEMKEKQDWRSQGECLGCFLPFQSYQIVS